MSASTAVPLPGGDPPALAMGRRTAHLMIEETTLTPQLSFPITVVVPTRNEAGNVRELTTRIRSTFADREGEILFVDDSDDGTDEVIAAVAAEAGMPVRLLHRPPGNRTDGLGGAVVAGLAQARYDWCVVMDADLQHPPELVPRLVDHGVTEARELVVASRYTGSGDAAGLSGWGRTQVSAWTTRLTRAAFPRRLHSVQDPMSGFFAVRRSAIDLDALRPDGFKILLEIAVRGRELRTGELPFHFAPRFAGESKAGAGEGLRFVRVLARLWFAARMRSRVGRVIGFASVGAIGIAVNSLALMAALGMGIHYLWGALLATEASTTFNWLLLELVVFTARKPGSRWRRYAAFSLVNHLALLARIPLLALLVERFGAPVVPANILTLIVVFAARFAVSDNLIFRHRRAS